MEVGTHMVSDGEPHDARAYQMTVGSLMHLMVGSRPDICYAVGRLAQYMSKPTEEHWQLAQRVFRYVKRHQWNILSFSGIEATIEGYVDASFADHVQSKSTTWYTFLIGKGACYWASKGQSLTAQSTTEADYIAATDAAKEAMWLRHLVQELGVKQTEVPLFGDNQSALALSRNPEFHARTKHIDVRFHSVRECIEKAVIDYKYVPTSRNTADVLTTALARLKHEFYYRKLGLENNSAWGGVLKYIGKMHC